ncbi:hypothetical protein BDP81DRAFT_109145 [Colletotrichum phormii]|uniref:Uncharacterized protein n=1 Tax=Colletotrichum phormii TaxID=359342 RepID=A0AAI9ZH25_9PEZI|nr:uncharacterized protein BDP81DRAFT_109145 [Colletotrichum phormii]KAK1624425.1 hypothetical protein BDP81DRAFT_109145 [Colletotrichum phormii]
MGMTTRGSSRQKRQLGLLVKVSLLPTTPGAAMTRYLARIPHLAGSTRYLAMSEFFPPNSSVTLVALHSHYLL